MEKTVHKLCSYGGNGFVDFLRDMEKGDEPCQLADFVPEDVK